MVSRLVAFVSRRPKFAWAILWLKSSTCSKYILRSENLLVISSLKSLSISIDVDCCSDRVIRIWLSCFSTRYSWKLICVNYFSHFTAKLWRIIVHFHFSNEFSNLYNYLHEYTKIISPTGYSWFVFIIFELVFGKINQRIKIFCCIYCSMRFMLLI